MKDKTALCKDSASREKYQIYLSISEAMPIFNERSEVRDSANREQNKINLFIFYAYLQRTDDNIKITADNL